MYEPACEPINKCNIDQMSFKAYLSRWLAASTKQAPMIYSAVVAKLGPSAQAAAAQCTGGDNGRTCGVKWTEAGVYDGTYGVGQQMSALEVIQSNLIYQVQAPVTNTTGGTSTGNSNAGSGSEEDLSDVDAMLPTTTGDRIGAGFLTAALLVAFLGTCCWMIV